MSRPRKDVWESSTQCKVSAAITSGARNEKAIDGKTVRGLRRYQQSLHLVSLVRHGSDIVLNQIAVAVNDKSNEITAVPPAMP